MCQKTSPHATCSPLTHASFQCKHHIIQLYMHSLSNTQDANNSVSTFTYHTNRSLEDTKQYIFVVIHDTHASPPEGAPLSFRSTTSHTLDTFSHLAQFLFPFFSLSFLTILRPRSAYAARTAPACSSSATERASLPPGFRNKRHCAATHTEQPTTRDGDQSSRVFAPPRHRRLLSHQSTLPNNMITLTFLLARINLFIRASCLTPPAMIPPFWGEGSASVFVCTSVGTPDVHPQKYSSATLHHPAPSTFLP